MAAAGCATPAGAAGERADKQQGGVGYHGTRVQASYVSALAFVIC